MKSLSDPEVQMATQVLKRDRKCSITKDATEQSVWRNRHCVLQIRKYLGPQGRNDLNSLSIKFQMPAPGPRIRDVYATSGPCRYAGPDESKTLTSMVSDLSKQIFKDINRMKRVFDKEE